MKGPHAEIKAVIGNKPDYLITSLSFFWLIGWSFVGWIYIKKISAGGTVPMLITGLFFAAIDLVCIIIILWNIAGATEFKINSSVVIINKRAGVFFLKKTFETSDMRALELNLIQAKLGEEGGSQINLGHIYFRTSRRVYEVSFPAGQKVIENLFKQAKKILPASVFDK